MREINRVTRGWGNWPTITKMEVFFTFLWERYERRSVMISSNLVFSQWDQIFKDKMTTMAAIDRLVHHAVILEFDGARLRVKIIRFPRFLGIRLSPHSEYCIVLPC